MPKIDVSDVPEVIGTYYPPEFNEPCKGRVLVENDGESVL